MTGLLVLMAILSAPQAAEVQVNVTTIPPLVIQDDPGYTGFEIDLWEAVCKNANLDPDYNEVEFKNIFNGLDSGSADVAIAGISMTTDRYAKYDFSYPTFNSGFSVAFLDKDYGYYYKLKNVLSSQGFLRILFAFLGFMLFFAHALWFSERGKNAIDDRYFPGIFEAFWCVLATVSTVGYGDIAPKKWLGRMLSACAIIFGIGFFGTFISEMSNITAETKSYKITSVDDLADTTIGTVQDTKSVEVAKMVDANVLLVESADDLHDLLADERVDAIVFDTPWILHYSKLNPNVAMLEEPLFEHYYGFATRKDDPLLERINRELLRMHETGQYRRIYDKWF